MLRQIALAVPDLARDIKQNCEADLAAAVTASLIHLNDDGRPDLLLQGTEFLHDGRAHLWLLAPDPRRPRLQAGIQPLRRRALDTPDGDAPLPRPNGPRYWRPRCENFRDALEIQRQQVPACVVLADEQE